MLSFKTGEKLLSLAVVESQTHTLPKYYILRQLSIEFEKHKTYFTKHGPIQQFQNSLFYQTLYSWLPLVYMGLLFGANSQFWS